MAVVKLEQYLLSILHATTADTNELRLNSGNKNFDLFTILLENHNTGVHRYQASSYQLLYVAAGEIKIKVDNYEYRLKPGNMLFLLNKCEYEVQQQTNSGVLVKLEFSLQKLGQYFPGNTGSRTASEREIIKQLEQKLEQQRFLYLKNTELSEPVQLINKIIDEYLQANLFAKEIIAAELKLLLITTIRKQDLNAAPATTMEFAGTELDRYIDANFADITLAEAAKHFGLNPNYFSSLVKQKTGKSFVEHVDERRMQEARNLLARPDISVKEIITLVGYHGKSFFYKKFNEYYHQTPVQMRSELFRQANINLK
ncbi:helix-turn-helix transcriptional regulator [Lactobacillus sp. ESL0681]|uniref:helix-turn-helix transcriptional regulator n=1 Tax=Lactobacillus sp. ESL0681 TaxID=2983211 RepID=UPI0023F91B4D|nr:helix-turn-helix transcriptional regulator [Lactobacillus sp. ESL0681]WEV39724.1 helix-turn-helix transcriptional regulator [Lactobacillus sp. ESL0681]